MFPSDNLQTINKQISQENIQLKQDLQTLQLENAKQLNLSKKAQEWKNSYDSLYQQNHTITNENHQLTKEIDELKDKIKNLEISLKQYQEKTIDLKNLDQIRNNIVSLQQQNQDLQRELKGLKQNEQFTIKEKMIIENSKQLYMVTLKWEKDIQNLQLKYRFEDDCLIINGYGQIENNYIVYQQIHRLQLKGLNQIEKPQIILKQQQMRMTFEI